MGVKNQGQRNLRFAVIGAGMAGILAAIRLRDVGYHDVVVFEKADSVGGTWRENTYPGLTCDTPSHAYTYSFAPNPNWSRYMPPGQEIFDYFEDIARRYGIMELIKFNQEVIRCEYINGRWELETKRGDLDCADFVIAATGVLHHPCYPNIEGRDTFGGALFHSARWDHSVPLDGRRIGVVGNGSTGVQIVSALASRAGKLTHFQRTAQWILKAQNDYYSEEQKAAFRADRELLRYMQKEPGYVALIKQFTDAIVDADSPGIQQIEALCLENLKTSVRDPVLKEKLHPNYRAACKRLVISPDYYQAIQHPNAELVNERIEQIEPEGVRTGDDRLHRLDVLVLATGFKADQFLRPMNVIGRNGAKLDEVWKLRPSAYLAVSLPDFPNLFMLNGPTGPVGNFPLIDIAEREMSYVMQLIELVARGACRTVCASHAAMADYEQQRITAAKRTVFASGCRSWYLDAEGVPSTWPWTYDAFGEAMEKPDLADYEFRE